MTAAWTGITRHASHVARYKTTHLDGGHRSSKHRRARAAPRSQSRSDIGAATTLDVPQTQAFPPRSSSRFAGQKAAAVCSLKELDAVIFRMLVEEGVRRASRCLRNRAKGAKASAMGEQPAAAAGAGAGAGDRRSAPAPPARADSRTQLDSGRASQARAAYRARPA